MACCQELDKATRVSSPFGRIVIVEWYDGPVAGVAECTACSKEYAFRLLAWDAEQRARILALGSLPSGSVERMVQVFKSAGEPTWPEWWPAMFPSDAARDAAWSEATKVLALSTEPELLVETTDLSRTIDSSIRLGSASQRAAYGEFARTRHTYEEWKAFMKQLSK
jgi:hypothetical protein